MTAKPRKLLMMWRPLSLCLLALTLAACVSAPTKGSVATLTVPETALTKPLVLVAYGDMRFTDPSETSASNPGARRALVMRVAAEKPAALFLSGDIPWHGIPQDYAVYSGETAPWRAAGLRVYPALGNHEFAQCEPATCLERWWSAFPELKGRRWYSVALGDRVLAVALDSNASLLPASEQRLWLEGQLKDVAASVRLVFIVLHHPPVADPQEGKMQDHNARENEQSLADYLETAGRGARARIVVSAGHIHNYERFERGGVTYLVSGGGGAKPYEVVRASADLYQGGDFPNFHYVRFELGTRTLVGEMFRLREDTGGGAPVWERRDRFEVGLAP